MRVLPFFGRKGFKKGVILGLSQRRLLDALGLVLGRRRTHLEEREKLNIC